MNIKGQGATGFPAGPPSFGDTWPLLFHRLEISVPTIVAPVRHGRGWSLMEDRDVVIVKSQQVEGVVLSLPDLIKSCSDGRSGGDQTAKYRFLRDFLVETECSCGFY